MAVHTGMFLLYDRYGPYFHLTYFFFLELTSSDASVMMSVDVSLLVALRISHLTVLTGEKRAGDWLYLP